MGEGRTAAGDRPGADGDVLVRVRAAIPSHQYLSPGEGRNLVKGPWPALWPGARTGVPCGEGALQLVWSPLQLPLCGWCNL